MKLATAAQMQEMDRRAGADFGIPSILLMENAAIRIADEIASRCGRGKRFVAYCGQGNNGGDGFAVARHLTVRYGWSGRIVLCANPESKSTADRDTNLAIASKMGIEIVALGEADAVPTPDCEDVIVDALLGTGLKGEPRKAVADCIDAINRSMSGVVVSLDVPSGVDSDTGSIYSGAVKADLTVTLALSKIGLHLAPASDCVGELVVANIGFPTQLYDDPTLTAICTKGADVAAWIASRSESRDNNKSTYGAVALFAGSSGFAGAATLCCLGAVRAGAGLVTLGVPEGMLDVMMARLPDVVMARGFLDTGGRAFRAAAVPKALEFVEKMDAVGFGPGISHEDQEIHEFTRDFVAQCPKPMVLDADVLTILSREDDYGAAITKSRRAATVLTPHPGEMGRLLGSSSKEVQADRLGSVRRAAEQFGCVVLLKGDRTLIAAPGGRLAINETGNSGMASGGMGDTLTGIATTFLAQAKDTFHAAAAAAYVHGYAGDLAASALGKAGLSATDLASYVPQAIRDCMEESIDG